MMTRRAGDAVAWRALIVQRDPRALLPGQFAARQLGLAAAVSVQRPGRSAIADFRGSPHDPSDRRRRDGRRGSG